MSQKATLLAEQIVSANRQLMATVEACEDEAWTRYVPEEQRTVAVVAHHVAAAYLVETKLVNALVGKGDETPLEWQMADIDEINATHARKHGQPTKSETLALLQTNSEVVARRVRELSDAQLKRKSILPFMGEEAVSTQTFIEKAVIGHIHGHRRSIEAVISLEHAM